MSNDEDNKKKEYKIGLRKTEETEVHRQANKLAGRIVDEMVSDDISLPKELTDRQKKIFKYMSRGVSQQALADLFGVSQPMIAKEVRKIRKVFAEKGKALDSNSIIGESVTVYGEVEKRAWALFDQANQDKNISNANRSLATVMAARSAHDKLLMDLGVIKRAPIEHDHSVQMSPFLKKLQEKRRQELSGQVIEAQFTELEEPTPPELPADIHVTEDKETEENS